MMEYKIEDQDNGQQAIIALPLEIAKVDYSFEYYDNDLKKMRSSHPNYWAVNESESTPWNMKVEVKEFKEVDNAIAHAIKIYMKYLREELKRVRESLDED